MGKAIILGTGVLLLAGCLQSTDPVPLPPQDPLLVSPANGSAIDPASVTFIWRDRIDVTPARPMTFNLQISSDSARFTMDGAVSFMRGYWLDGIHDTSFTATMLPHLPAYYWRVIGFDASGGQEILTPVWKCVYHDTSHDIDFQAPRTGQYSEWEYRIGPYITPVRLGIRVVGRSGDSVELLQSADGVLSTAYLLPQGNGYAYSGDIAAFRLAGDFPDGFSTRDTSRIFSYSVFAAGVKMGTDTGGKFAARDSDFNFEGNRYGPSDFLVSHFSSSLAEIVQLRAVGMDPFHGLVFAYRDFGSDDKGVYYRVARPHPAP